MRTDDESKQVCCHHIIRLVLTQLCTQCNIRVIFACKPAYSAYASYLHLLRSKCNNVFKSFLYISAFFLHKNDSILLLAFCIYKLRQLACINNYKLSCNTWARYNKKYIFELFIRTHTHISSRRVSYGVSRNPRNQESEIWSPSSSVNMCTHVYMYARIYVFNRVYLKCFFHIASCVVDYKLLFLLRHWTLIYNNG